ncbi:MAG: class I SAM-dependent methyltransferase [Alphaproteobacteria bacterium]|nr:class I SAM-dependent methyltransferase [Alphaproteobacteria bacterium]
MNDLSAFIEKISSALPSENQKNFLKRVWSGDSSRYAARIQALGFENMAEVLDAGCGYGQWSMCLAKLNTQISACDYDPLRINIAEQIATRLGHGNIKFDSSSIENLPYKNESFDGVFSYSVLYLSDYKKSLEEFRRVLKPGGLLYFSTNGLGWYLYNLIETHNDSDDFSSRQMAADTLANTLNYHNTGTTPPGASLVMPKDVIIPYLADHGWEVLASGPDGSLHADKHRTAPFYANKSYCGYETVWEALCRKK